MDITQKLDQLAEFMSQRDLIGIHKQEAIDAVLTIIRSNYVSINYHRRPSWARS